MKLEDYKKRLVSTITKPRFTEMKSKKDPSGKRVVEYKLQRYEIEVEKNDKTITLTRYSDKTYEEIVEDMVKTKYSLAQEVAILRQQYTKIDEYNEYYQFVEQCKALAKEFINERNTKFGG